jgi:hypothetical protein
MNSEIDALEVLTSSDVKQSLTAHAANKGREIFAKYGPRIGWSELLRILEDRACVRYPCRVLFEFGELQSGEFAHPVPIGDLPEEGYLIHVHPCFMSRLEQVPFLVLYQLVLVNYGPFASAADAEAFGAAALGIAIDDYYQLLCQMADEVSGCGSDISNQL